MVMEDWSLIYKVSFLATSIFHPSFRVRVFSFYFMLLWFVLGLIRNYLFGDMNWFLYQAGYETILLIVLPCLIFTNSWQTKVIYTIGISLVLLNLHQYLGWYKGDIFYDSFLSTSDYIYWNKWGFEVILLMLWMKEEVFSATRSRWTVNNVIMVYVIGWIVYLAGNYWVVGLLINNIKISVVMWSHIEYYVFDMSFMWLFIYVRFGGRYDWY